MRLITLAIHTYEKALNVRALLEAEGIQVTLQNVNLEQPVVSSGVRVRIAESDLPLALRIIENPDLSDATLHQSLSPASARVMVVPTDFSEHSFNAAVAATHIAHAHKVDIKFLYAYIDPHVTGTVQLSEKLTYAIADNDVVEKIVNEANEKMRAFTKRLKEMMKSGALPVVRFTHAIVEGVPEDAIIEQTKLDKPYLVVMGTRKAVKKEKELIGSVTAEVLNDCHFTVLSVPENTDISTCVAPKNILFFSNLNQEDIIAMDTLRRIYPESDAKVTIVHIPRRNRFTERAVNKSAMALVEYCQNKFPNFTFQTETISPKTAVAEMARLQPHDKFDLIVMQNRRRNAFTRFLNPGLAHKFLFQADIPMFVIPV